MKSQLKILYLLTSPLSVNTFGSQQIKALYEHGFAVYLVCGPGDLNSDLFKYTTNIYTSPYLRRGLSPIWDFISVINLFLTILRIKPVIIIYSTPKSALLGALASFFNRTPIRIYQVWGVRWQNLSGIKLWLIRSADFLAMLLSTNITIVSKSVLQFISALYKTKKMIVIGSGSTAGVDSQIFYPSKPSMGFNPKLKIGYAGRVSNDKGVSELYDLFIKLISQIPNLHLEIIGDLDLDDKISDKLVSDIKSHSKIQWTGNIPQDELAEHMRSWDLQIFLSKREGLGNVIIEAGACGVPTFCWNIIGTKDAIPEFAQDFLIPYGDTNYLEKSVISYLNSPLDQSEKIALSNWCHENFEQKKVLSNFTEFMNGNLEEYYDSK
jgi:glycosyltransferase involved in cell wall biosynthesis